jgi:hypothetical protein
MACADRDKLLELFLEAARASSEAMHALPGSEGEALERLKRLAESARKTYADCLEVLTAHERSHGCAPKVDVSPPSVKKPT